MTDFLKGLPPELHHMVVGQKEEDAPTVPQYPQPRQPEPPSRLEQGAQTASDFIGGMATGMGGGIVGVGGPVNNAASMSGYYAGQGASWVMGAKGISTVLNMLTKGPSASTTALNVFQRLGQQSIAAESGIGAVAGVGGYYGGEIGGDLMGAGGELGGEFIGAALSSVPTAVALNGLRTLTSASRHLFLNDSIPTAEQLKGASDVLYKALDDFGVTIDGAKIVPGLEDFAYREGIKFGSDNPSRIGRSIEIIKKAADEGRLTYGVLQREIEALSPYAGGSDTTAVAYKNAVDYLKTTMLDTSKKSNIVLDNIRLPGKDGEASRKAVAMTLEEVVETAGRTYQRYSSDRAINEAFDRAYIQSLENVNKQGTPVWKTMDKTLRSLVEGNGQGKYLDDRQKAVLKRALEGTSLEEIFRRLGKLRFNSEDFVRTMIMGAGVTSIGGAVGGVPGAATGAGLSTAGFLTAHVIGKAAHNRAANMFEGNVRLAQQAIRAGNDPVRAYRAYQATVPKPQQNPEDLAMLFIRNNVDTGDLANITISKGSYLLSDAVMLTNAMRTLGASEDERAEAIARRRQAIQHADARRSGQVPSLDVPTVPNRFQGR